MFDLTYSVIERNTDLKFGEIEAYQDAISAINTIKGLQLLLEASNDYYPKDNKEVYKKSLNNLIKGYTKLLEVEMDRINNFYNLSKEG